MRKAALRSRPLPLIVAVCAMALVTAIPIVRFGSNAQIIFFQDDGGGSPYAYQAVIGLVLAVLVPAVSIVLLLLGSRAAPYAVGLTGVIDLASAVFGSNPWAWLSLFASLVAVVASWWPTSRRYLTRRIADL